MGLTAGYAGIVAAKLGDLVGIWVKEIAIPSPTTEYAHPGIQAEPGPALHESIVIARHPQRGIFGMDQVVEGSAHELVHPIHGKALVLGLHHAIFRDDQLLVLLPVKLHPRPHVLDKLAKDLRVVDILKGEPAHGQFRIAVDWDVASASRPLPDDLVVHVPDIHGPVGPVLSAVRIPDLS